MSFHQYLVDDAPEQTVTMPPQRNAACRLAVKVAEMLSQRW
jgi:hypothetical protein